MTNSKRIYLSPPHMGADERELLMDAFDSNWIAPLGPHVDAFENEICQRLGIVSGAALASGTGALHLALLIIGISQGDTVFCSDLTFASSANVIRYVQAEPVFIDADEISWNMDPNLLEEELERCAKHRRLPKAVIVVDLYGQCADYDRISEICKNFDIPIIEDAAEALGATYKNRYAGSFGDMGVLSFNGNKIMTTSNGGMLLSNEKKWIDKARFLATQAREPFPHYEHKEIGYNYRMSNLLAAVGRGQLRHLDERIATRQLINQKYREMLSTIPGITFMPEAAYGKMNCWLTCILVDPVLFGATREDIRIALEAENIEARPVWKPMHLQPVFKDCRVVGGNLSESLFEQGLCLPSGSSLRNDDQVRIVELIAGVGKCR